LMWVIVIVHALLLTLGTNWFECCENASGLPLQWPLYREKYALDLIKYFFIFKYKYNIPSFIFFS